MLGKRKEKNQKKKEKNQKKKESELSTNCQHNDYSYDDKL